MDNVVALGHSVSLFRQAEEVRQTGQRNRDWALPKTEPLGRYLTVTRYTPCVAGSRELIQSQAPRVQAMKGQPTGEMAFEGAGRHKCLRVDLFY